MEKFKNLHKSIYTKCLTLKSHSNHKKMNIKSIAKMALPILMLCSIIGCKKDETLKVFTLSSADITDVFKDENFGNGFNGCTGDNKSPQLRWENAPAGTKSFAITLVDINAFGPGVSFDHWMVINIPPTTNSLDKDAGNISGTSLPNGAIQTPNGAAAFDVPANAAFYKAFAGVCPNVGNTNQYEITVFALNVASLPVSEIAASSEVKTAIASAVISSTKMSVTASR